MKIYTKTGDGGETSLFGGGRVPKDHPRIEVYGTVDELNSLIGVCLSLDGVGSGDAVLAEIQHDLFSAGAELADPQNARRNVSMIDSGSVQRLERHIDRMTAEINPLTQFILPGGITAAAMIHVARTVCRRVERQIVSLSVKETVSPELLVYFNRLSDLLFTLSRWVNSNNNISETPWNSKTNS